MMKNYKIPILIVTLIMGGFATSCVNEYDDFETQRIVSGDINLFMAGLSKSAETYLIDNEEEFSFRSLNGHQISFSTNDIDTDNSANTEIAYKVSNTVGDLVLNNITTISGLDIVNVDCVFDISMWSDDSRLMLKPNSDLAILKPQSGDLENRSLFTIPSETEHIWSDISSMDESSLQVVEWESELSGQTLTGFDSHVSALGEYVIGKPLPDIDSGKAAICATVPAGFNGTNTKVFLTLDGTTTLIPLVWNSENMLFCDLLGNIPNLLIGDLISISEKADGSIYFGTIDVLVEDGFEYQLNPIEYSKEELVDKLRKL